MKCPTCPDVKLVMTDRQGIEIDYCPDCRGVWLDRGELDKLIEKSVAAQPQPEPQQTSARHRPDDDYRRDEYRKDDYYKKGYYKKRKSFLSEIFD